MSKKIKGNGPKMKGDAYFLLSMAVMKIINEEMKTFTGKEPLVIDIPNVAKIDVDVRNKNGEVSINPTVELYNEFIDAIKNRKIKDVVIKPNKQLLKHLATQWALHNGETWCMSEDEIKEFADAVDVEEFDVDEFNSDFQRSTEAMFKYLDGDAGASWAFGNLFALLVIEDGDKIHVNAHPMPSLKEMCKNDILCNLIKNDMIK